MYLTRPIQQTPTSTALAVINTALVLTVGQGHTLRLESSDFERHDQKDSRVGASALVMLFQSLIVSGGKRKISCSLLVLGTGYDTEWE